MTHTAIVIQQPWAEFILAGLKAVENRVWRSTYTGVLLILAGKQFDEKWREKFQSMVAQHQAIKYISKKNISYRGRIQWKQGYIVGAVIMTDCDDFYDDRWCQSGLWFHRYKEPYRFIKPVEYRGTQRLFQPRVTIEQFDPADYSWLKKMHEVCSNTELSKGE